MKKNGDFYRKLLHTKVQNYRHTEKEANLFKPTSIAMYQQNKCKCGVQTTSYIHSSCLSEVSYKGFKTDDWFG